MRRALVVALLLWAAPARADDACRDLEQALAAAPDDLDARADLATCREDHGQLATAWKLWRDVKARARAASDTKRAVIATDHVTSIEPQLAHLTLALPRGTEAPDGLTVTLDGAPVALDDLGAAAAIDQGNHRVTADATGFAAWSKELFIENGAFKTVELGPLEVDAGEVPVDPGEPDVQPTEHPSDPPRPPPPQTRKYLGIAGVAIGGVAMGIGAWAGLSARSTRDDAIALGCSDDLSSCPTGAAFDTAGVAYGRANVSTALFASGAVIATLGAILWITAPGGVSASAGPDHVALAYRASF